MSNTMKKFAGVAGRLLLAYLLVLSQSAWAGQEQKPKDNPKPAQKAAPQQTAEKPSANDSRTKAKTEEAESEEAEKGGGEKSPEDGKHEGIKVHGHWTIEVKNPDGSLVKHIEFENSLDPGYSVSVNTRTVQIPGGASYLAALLAGQVALPIWAIGLVGPAGLTNPQSTANAPCVYSGSNAGIPNMCFIYSPLTTLVCSPQAVLPAGISCNLRVVPLGTAPTFTGIQLTGSVQVTQTGQVSTVVTGIEQTCIPQTTCPFASSMFNLEWDTSITSSTNFPGAPILVSAGQTVAVTVNISFS